MVLGAVGQQHHPLRFQCLGRARIVGDQDHRTLVATQRIEHLFARCRVEVVGGLVEQQDVGGGGHQTGQCQARLLTARQRCGGLIELRAGEHESAQQAA